MSIRFEDQKLTSFSGLLVFQLLFRRIELWQRLKECFVSMKESPVFGHHLIVMLLIVHLLIGFRPLREIDYYRDDPLVLRLMGLRKLPDVSMVSRSLSQIKVRNATNTRHMSRDPVIEGLLRRKAATPNPGFRWLSLVDQGPCQRHSGRIQQEQERGLELLSSVLHCCTDRTVLRRLSPTRRCLRFQWGGRIHDGLLHGSQESLEELRF